MTQVLQDALVWEEAETEEELSQALIGRKICQYEVFCSGSGVLLLLALSDQSAVVLVADGYINEYVADHNLTHVFATDLAGNVVENIPTDLEIEEIKRESTESVDRKCMCCGISCNRVFICALTFTFRSTNDIVRLSSWTQCKAFMDDSMDGCRDPHVPYYNQFGLKRVTSFGLEENCTFDELRQAIARHYQPGEMLSLDFLGAVSHFGGHHLFDASGLEPLAARISPAEVNWLYWSITRARSAREHTDRTNARFVVVEDGLVNNLRMVTGGPRLLNRRGSDTSNFPPPFRPDDMAEETGNENVFFLPGDRMNLRRFNTMSSDSLLSQCLSDRNLDGWTKRFQLLCWNMHDVCSIASYVMGGESSGGSRELSLRVTFPDFALGGMSNNLMHQGRKSHNLMHQIKSMFSSRVAVHNGASLGYHLVESSEGRLVLTLFGSASELKSDTSKIETLQSTLASVSPFWAGSQQYAVLKVVNPTKSDFKAFACHLGTICCDVRNKSIYSAMHFGRHGNAVRPSSLNAIQSILQSMLQPPPEDRAWNSSRVTKIIRV